MQPSRMPCGAVGDQRAHDPAVLLARLVADDRRRTAPRRSRRGRSCGRRRPGRAPRARARAGGRRRSPAPSCTRSRAGRRASGRAERTASAVVSAMWTNGIVDRHRDLGASLCIVLVHSTSSSAPAASSACASRASTRARLGPAVLALQHLDVGEVDAAQQAVGGVQAAEALGHELVDEPVVLDRRLPAHPAEQADALHRSSRGGSPGELRAPYDPPPGRRAGRRAASRARARRPPPRRRARPSPG